MGVRTVAVRLTAEVSQYVNGMNKAERETADLTTKVKTAAVEHKRTADVADASGRRTGRSLDGISTSAGAMKLGVIGAAAGAGVALVSFAKDSLGAASALNEQLSATKTLFGDAADEMIEFGESASSIGLSETAALKAANAFGDLFTKIGYTEGAAQTFSEDLVRMAADFASFKDLDPDDVLGKLRSGLSGESEPLRDLGVFLNEAKVQAEGMSLGLANASGEMDEGAKVAARYSLIMKEMGDAYGDVGRTSDSYANTQRRATAELDDLEATIGQGLLPIMADLSSIAGDVANSMGGAAESANDGSWVDSVPVLSYVAIALDKLAGDSEGAAEASEYLADSQKALQDAQSRTARQAALTTKQIDDQAKALDDLLAATQSQFSSEVAYNRAVLGIAGDIEKYNEALHANRDGKTDNDVSARELAEQELGLRDALLGAGEAAVRQAEDNAQAAGRTLTESQKYNVFRDALLDLKGQFPQLGSRIDEYVSRLDKVPAEVKTQAKLTGAELAAAKAEALRAALARIPALTDVTVRYNEVNGLTVQRGTTPGRVTERASGGWISGPGTGTSDSIPARLSDGEFVVNARSAEQNAALLEAINGNRFATGGWVSGRSGGASAPASTPAGSRAFIEGGLTIIGRVERDDATHVLHKLRDEAFKAGQ